MNRILLPAAFLLGAIVIAWIGIGFIGRDFLAFAVTLLIAVGYGLGCFEMWQFRRASHSLFTALQPGQLRDVNNQDSGLSGWVNRLHDSLRNSVRLRIEGERVALPGPVYTPYLVGLLVMLGLLGTFMGMVVTLNGAVLALEGTTELQAMRAGLATPIKGLGLAFGTSVAGVAASAMLGLISTLCRRERLQASQLLDSAVANELREFSLQHNRQQTFKAMQEQADLLPKVAERLQSMADNMERMTETLTNTLLESQAEFQKSSGENITRLTDSVQRTLQSTLEESGRAAGEGIKPMMEAAMKGLLDQTHETQKNLHKVSEGQLQSLLDQFGATSKNVSDAWAAALDTQQKQQTDTLHSVNEALQGFNQRIDQATRSVLDGFSESVQSWLEQQQLADQQRQQLWSASLQNASSQMLEQQTTAMEGLQSSATRISHDAEKTSAGLLENWHQVLQQSSELVQQRMQSERDWLQDQGQRMTDLTGTIQSQLTALRNDETQRGEAAVAKLQQLEATVAEQLAQLGAALEQPMTRLIETATEAPQAAADVIAQLRAEITHNAERDNELLEERQRIMADLNGLLQGLQQAATEQRSAIESLVSNSSQQLVEVGQLFGHSVETESDKLANVANNIEASAVEVASVSDAFSHAMELFGESSKQLVEGLSRVEESLEKNSTRSDEQLAYYVAQAREIIDLSMMSQKEIIEELRHSAEKSEADTLELKALDAQDSKLQDAKKQSESESSVETPVAEKPTKTKSVKKSSQKEKSSQDKQAGSELTEEASVQAGEES